MHRVGVLPFKQKNNEIVMLFVSSGTILSDFPITLPITRQTDDGLEKIPVTYYPMLVDELADKWPEKGDRKRNWVRMKEAKNVVPGRDMLDVVKRFDKLLPWVKDEIAKLDSKKENKLKLVK